VALYGGYPSGGGARDWKNNETILSGDIGTLGNSSDNCYHVVTGSDTDGTAVLDGFTVSGGNASGSDMDGFGGGMYNYESSPNVKNTIFAGNTPKDCAKDPLISGGYNLDCDGSCLLTHPPDLPNTNPLLGPLQDNGGPTKTHALFPGSPAIDAIPPPYNGAPPTSAVFPDRSPRVAIATLGPWRWSWLMPRATSTATARST
jgi:hypothetical protein